MDDGFRAACAYARNGDIQQMKAWLLSGGDANQVDADNASLGHHTLNDYWRTGDRSDMIRLLVSHGMDVNHTQCSPSLLHRCKFPKEAAFLIESGADVNATSSYGETVLIHYVNVQHHGLELIRLLLHHGCDVLAVNDLYGECFDVDGVSGDVAGYARKCYNISAQDPDDVGEDELSRQLATATFLEDVKAAGSWKAYLRAPRVQLVRLRSLCDRGRAAPPSVASGKLQRLRNLSAAEVAVFARLFGAPTPGASSGRLPNEIFWHILAFWRTDRD